MNKQINEKKKEENKMTLTSPKGPIQRLLLSPSRQEMMAAWPSACQWGERRDIYVIFRRQTLQD